MPVTPLCRLLVFASARTRTKMPALWLGGECMDFAAYVLLCPPRDAVLRRSSFFWYMQSTCRPRIRHHSTKVEGLIPHDAVLPKSFPADAQGAQPCCVAAITRQRSGVSGATIGDRLCPQRTRQPQRPAFGDPRFLAKLAVCRWEGFAFILADMIVLTHARLLEAGVPRELLDARLGDLYRTILWAIHPPTIVPRGWDARDCCTARRTRRTARRAGQSTGRCHDDRVEVFDTLPFPPRDPVENRMVLSNPSPSG